MTDERPPLRPGDAAPRFTLPAVNRDGEVSLDDYLGRSPVLVGLFRGLHCPFCRRQVVQLGQTQAALRAAGVETLAIVNTTPERARLYFTYRPVPVGLAADPDAATHRAFGVPAFTFVDHPQASRWPWRVTMGELQSSLINPTGELPAPMGGLDALAALNAKDGFQPTEVDQQIMARHGTQLAGHYLIDRDGVIRWSRIEGQDRITDIGTFPSGDELAHAAQALAP
jgi:peroxiredoxin